MKYCQSAKVDSSTNATSQNDPLTDSSTFDHQQDYVVHQKPNNNAIFLT